MSVRLAIAAEPADGDLAGLRGRFAWGEAWTGAPEERPPSAEVSVGLRGMAPVEGCQRRVRWFAGAPAEGQTVGESGELTLGTQGDKLWRRAPWPVNDTVFELEPPARDAGVLVVGMAESLRIEQMKKCAERGLPVAGAERLTLAGLTAAAVVVLLSEDREALPAEAISVLAAGRVLISDHYRVSFGLEPGLDYLGAKSADAAAQSADAAIKHWAALAGVRAFGSLAAERHRASLVYGRMLDDLRL